MYYSGIDLHKDNCFITTINEAGELVQQERVPNVSDAVLSYFDRIGTEHQTVVESRVELCKRRDDQSEVALGCKRSALCCHGAGFKQVTVTAEKMW